MKREDIESFGFEYYEPIMSFDFFEKEPETQIGDVYLNEELNIMLGYYHHSRRITIATLDPSKNDFYAQYNKDNFAIGSLRIETKEELKFIMDRLPKN
jgi:hypothetical protein